jgi:hypothetical protein
MIRGETWGNAMPSRLMSLILRLAGAALLLAVLPVQAAGLRLTLWPAPPIFTGTSYSLGVAFEKEDRNDGIVHTGPFTFRTTLPVGVQYLSYNGVSWSCSAAPNLRDVTCTYPTAVDFWNPVSMSLSINATTAAAMTIGPITLTGTIASAQVPLPPVPNCLPSPSLSGCASTGTSVVQSQVRISGWGVSGGTVTTGQVATWTGQPFEAGTSNHILVLDTHNIGFGQVNTPVTIDYWLPAGFSYAGTVSGIPGYTCAAQTPPAHVRCTTPYFYDTLSGFISLRVNVANDVAVPGPLFVHAAISNNVQAAPSDCVANPAQLGCARLQLHTRVPRVAVLVSDGISHGPATVILGEEASLTVGYRNIGEAIAGSSNIYIRLPPFFEYRGLLSSSPAATCSTLGTLAAGQVVSCNSSGLGAAPFGQGSLSLRLFAYGDAASPGPLTVLAAVDLASPANPALLNSCAANPNQSFCAAHTIPTYFPCALQHGAEGIFCDGLQPFVRP